MNDRTLNPVTPELLSVARSSDKTKVDALIGENKSVGHSAQLLSIEALRSAVTLNDPKGLSALLLNAAEVNDPQLVTYSAERAWRVTLSYLREGKERQSNMMLSAMPAAFHAANKGRDRDEALLLSANLHMRPASALLMDNGANPAYKDLGGMTALMHFARNGDPQLLSEGVRVLEVQKEGLGTKSLSLKNDEGWTVGMFSVVSQASELAKKKTMEALAEAGFAFNQPQGKDGFTEIHMAAGMGDVSSIKHLVNTYGAAVDTCSGNSMTPLMVAAYANQDESIKTLAGLGAMVNVKRGLDGLTAAHLAASLGQDEAIKALHSAGADLQLQAWETMDKRATPADMAREMGCKATAKLINTLQPSQDRQVASSISMRLHDLLSPIKKSVATPRMAP